MSTTKIILRQDYENLGEIGEVVEVKSGYARNFLIPRGIAYRATDGALRAVEAEKQTWQAKQSRLEEDARVIAEKLESVSITIPMRVGEEDRLFGSVTALMIAEELGAQGHNIDRRAIQIDDPIKTLGMFDVPVKLHKNVTTALKVFVVDEEGSESE
ncbi:MAG: 50S ribosomal protein L9 [Ignavibacteriae bacterium]|nr:50S ribosomal protein L9 [Ignavibacteriota bacterium]MCB9216768.1 50S ribosomal protein L9 [Ignavibacteria bacterium]